MRKSGKALGWIMIGVAFFGCRGPEVEEPTAVSEEIPSAMEAREPELDPKLESQVVWTAPELLSGLERRGFTLSSRIGIEGGDGSLRELSDASFFAPLVETLERDLAEFREGDPHLGVGVARYSRRLFDPAWLRGETSYFELVGVVNRLDRRPFVEDACGEVRLVYRLAYRVEEDDQVVMSRLPMTLTVDWLQDPPREGSCAESARRWQRPGELSLEEEIAFLIGSEGPLSLERLGKERIHRVQVNMQSVRWPSTVHPSLGGHAEYVLRSFVPGVEGILEAEKLENTPDVEAIRRNRELRDDLKAWILDEENLREIDQGWGVLPERFRGDRVISVAPRGHSRQANQPFRALFSEEDFQGADFSELSFVRSGEGLIRRLDDQSCAGCHQGRALAGFHLLGEDPEETPVGNALATAISPHGLDELDRRRRLNDEEVRGERGEYWRGFSLRPSDALEGGYGTPCGLSEDPAFRSWGCAEGLMCRPYDQIRGEKNHLGVCLPLEPSVGDPCEVGNLRTGMNYRADQVVDVEAWSCPDRSVCNTNQVGFPGGMCTSSCGNPGPDGRCGAIAVLVPFNRCLAQRRPFEECVGEHVSPAGLRSCDESAPCRHDYLCAQNGEGEGVCIPPYFLFQMRVDGHPAGR